MSQEQSRHDDGGYGPDVRIVRRDGRRFVIVGTAHISRESVELVRRVIDEEAPDCVCVELDERRCAALREGERWEQLDLKEIIRRKQIPTLLVGIVLSSYQKRLGLRLGVRPGAELVEAVETAEERGVRVVLADRDIRVTLARAWRETSFLRKWLLLGVLVESLFDRTEVTEETLRELRRGDLLSEMLEELGRTIPSVKKVLIEERDAYLASKAMDAPGERIVVVVGAGHAEGIAARIEEGRGGDLALLEEVPKRAPWGKILGWGIPAVILGALGFLGWRDGAAVMGQSAVYWILANGIPSAIGAALAMGHPLTVVAAFLAAPLTSLTPVIGAGYVTALVQAVLRPPRVLDFQSVADDVHCWRAWWRNRLLRVFLAFLLPGVGSMIGTWLGGYRIVSDVLTAG